MDAKPDGAAGFGDPEIFGVHRILIMLSWLLALGNPLLLCGFLAGRLLTDGPSVVVVFGYEATLSEPAHAALFLLYWLLTTIFAYGYLALYYDSYREPTPQKGSGAKASPSTRSRSTDR